jgi:hypothetical protein
VVRGSPGQLSGLHVVDVLLVVDPELDTQENDNEEQEQHVEGNPHWAAQTEPAKHNGDVPGRDCAMENLYPIHDAPWSLNLSE